jgi:spore germination protein GerM
MTELCRGPRADSGLAGAVPKGCGLRGVTMKNGVVTVDLTREFWNEVDELDDDETQTLRCILFTIRQFPGVKEVRLQVEGQSVQLPDDLQQTFVNVASEVMAYYPGVIETD